MKFLAWTRMVSTGTILALAGGWGGTEMVVMVAAWLMEPRECPTLASAWRAWLSAATSMYIVCGKQVRGDRGLSPYSKSALMSDEVWRAYNFREGLMLKVGQT